MHDEAELWMHRFVTDALAPDRHGPLIDRINEFIADSVAEVAADRELRRDLEASTREQSRAFLAALIAESTVVNPPAAAHELARAIARKGLDLRVLMQIYRVGQKAIVRYVADTATEQIADPTQTPQALLRLWDSAGEWLNVSLEILAETYRQERELGLRGVFARRAETVQEVLRGQVSDPTVLSHRLGYSPLRYNTAAVLSTQNTSPDDIGDTIGTLESVARSIAHVIGSQHLLTVPAGSQGLWAWISTATPDYRLPVDTAPERSSSAVRVALGNPAAGVDGFRTSHREAQAAHDLQDRVLDPRQLIRFTDIELAHLLEGHPQAAATLVSRELRGLDGRDANSAQLRQTLRVFLANSRSYDAAARQLGVHKNTVRYRIQRAEQLLGHPIDSARLKLELALEYLNIVGDDTLRT